MNRYPIVLLTNEYPPSPHGGIGVYTQTFARALCRNGWRVRVAGVYPREHAHEGCRMDEGVEVWRLARPRKDFAGIGARTMLYRQVAEWSRKGEAALVEAPDAEGWTAFWPDLAAVRVVRVHGSSAYFASEMKYRRTWRSRLCFVLERSALKRADFWCSASKYSALRTQELFGLPPCDAVLYNAVPVSSTYPVTERTGHRVVFTGTLTEKKGIVSLLKAWPLVHERISDAELHILGKYFASGASVRRKLTSEMLPAAAEKIFYHGHLPGPEVRRFLEGSRVAVFPSFAEAFALAPMEAMACGCPTIYSTRTSGPELITPEQDGLLVDPADPRQIADAIIRVLEDDALAQKLSYAGWKRIHDAFSFDAVLPAFEQFYQNCISRLGLSSVARQGARRPLEGDSYL